MDAQINRPFNMRSMKDLYLSLVVSDNINKQIKARKLLIRIRLAEETFREYGMIRQADECRRVLNEIGG